MAKPTGESKRKPKMTPGKIAYAVLILLLVVLVLYLLIARLSGKIPSLFGYSVVRIVTPSMEPKIPVGSFVLIRRISPEDVSPGDVITFFTDDPDPLVAGKTITHRVLSVSFENGKYVFATQGDNQSTNPVPDAYPARGERLVGRYVCGMLPVTAVVSLYRTHLPIAILITLLIPTVIAVQSMIKKTMKRIPAEREDLIRRRVEEELARLREADKNPNDDNRPDKGTNQS
ncbi:MAG: signal peptidase I [Clostridia bacterium]|nr:signal peptidase I [Clostridia bacterium]